MKFENLIGDWQELKDRIRERWQDLRDEDLRDLESGGESLLGALQSRYGLSKGQARAELEHFAQGVQTTLRDAAEHVGAVAADAWHRGKDHMRDALATGRRRARELWSDGRERARDMYDGVEGAVRARPLTAVATAIGIGVLLTLLLRPRR